MIKKNLKKLDVLDLSTFDKIDAKCLPSRP